MKNIYFLLITLILSTHSYTQCPGANLFLNTQEEVDQFIIDYPDCTEILGTVKLDNSSITNLHGLRNITKINGDLRFRFNHELTSLDGLDSLKYIGQILRFQNNTNLENIDALRNLEYVGKDIVLVGYDKLQNVDALSGISYVPGTLIISYHDDLLDLEGLSNIDSIGYQLNITNNPKLIDFYGLRRLKKIADGGISQIEGDGITSLRGLDSLESTGALWIEFMPRLKTLEGLESWTTATGYTSRIGNNDSLASLHGLQGLKNIYGDFVVNFNPFLENLDGLDNLEYVENDLVIGNLDVLEDIHSLESLQKVGDKIQVWNTPRLKTLFGLQNADLSDLQELNLFDNVSLDVCAVQSVCDYLDAGGIHEIYGNKTGCNDSIEILEKCETVSVTESDAMDFKISPNPSSDHIEISGLDLKKSSVKIIDRDGRLVMEKIDPLSNVIEIDGLTSGMYFLIIEGIDYKVAQKFVKL